MSEPELGLGEVRAVGPRTVTLWFGATKESRQYVASDEAPIRRAAFRPGDTITTQDGRTAVVDSVSERNGLLHYRFGDRECSEADLSHALSFNSPLERLFAGQFDPSNVFELRLEALRHQHHRRQSAVRGFVGGRIDLLPHQLGIAAEVTSRLLPRVLLADEVGLGKTIEACLIVHRLLLTGRAQRVLVIVPETLVHQWFLELLRRFNLWFHIFNESRCAAIEEANPGANPFTDDQLVLCDLGLLTQADGRLEQALDAGWDLVVVDEAHHLGWSPDAPSPEYTAIERLGATVPGLLLLTATPEQLGVAGHFARLRLLDRDRFHDLDAFMREADAYQAVAHVAGALDEGRPLSAAERSTLAATLGDSQASIDSALSSPNPSARGALIERLLDQHGTGRVMFRNTRGSIGGLPARRVHLHPLTSDSASALKALGAEWLSDMASAETDEGRLSLAHDPRIEWLVSLLQSLAPEKVLLICQTPRKAVAIESALRHHTTIATAAFHEQLTLIQRDRGAASFAEPDGARLLICSEIGSEGRNFQFAHHLVLFDLPIDPGLVEQRIGRLDRIGQRGDIHIHVPVVADTHVNVLARWYHEGLTAFEQPVPGSRELLERFEPRLRDMAGRAYRDRRTLPSELARFLADVRRERQEVAVRLEQGRDRLLEWHSFRPAQSGPVIDEIQAQDANRSLDEFMLAVFDLFFVQVEAMAPQTYRLGSAGVLVDDFPGLNADGLIVTTDRQRALLREDLQFLTWDHPLATGALDVLLSSERGNCAIARWPDPSVSALYLDVVFTLECLTPAALHVDRFLPPTPVRIVVDHRGQDASALVAGEPLVRPVRPEVGKALLTRADLRDRLLPTLVDRATQMANAQAPALVNAATALMQSALSKEVARLRDLQKVNRLVRQDEIDALLEQQSALAAALAGARPRIDCVRLIHRGPER